MAPFLVLIALCVFGIIRSIWVLSVTHAMGILVLLFWLIRNVYFLVMSVFLIDGRDESGEDVTVIDAEPVTVKLSGDPSKEEDGITTDLTSHSIKVYMDDAQGFKIGDKAELTLMGEEAELVMECIITSITYSRHGESCVLGFEIIDTFGNMNEYMQVLYDRIPTLPQSLTRDYGIIKHMLKNIAYRILR